jgi:hypothetical protein
MRHLLATSLALGGAFATLVGPFACDDTPRGEQGIDYLVDGSYYNVPPNPDASADAQGPCTEEADPNGVCTQISAAGTAYTHLITCSAKESPYGLTCTEAGAASVSGVGTFCCTTGIL